MQQYQLTINANSRPETLERLLRVIRHRGFNVIRLNAENHGSEIKLELTVESVRALDLLVNQLVKLPDVIALNNP